MTDLANRCESYNPNESIWSHVIENLDFPRYRVRWRARCVKPKGHPGSHLGPDESVWQETRGETEDECTPKE